MAAGVPWVRIVIVNYNAGALLQACVDALAGQTLAEFEAVIVDNASTIAPVSSLRLPDARFNIRPAGSNTGFAAGTNLGAQGNACPWLATLNPDTAARPDWLAELRAATLRHPWAAMFGSTQLRMDDPGIVDGFGDVLSAFGTAWRSGNGGPVEALPDNDCEVFSPCAAAALYKMPQFDRVGGFDERFFCYLEDVDLGFRLRLRGERCVQVRRAEVLHAASAIAGHLSAFSVFHSYRNRIWLFLKNTPWPLLAPILALQSVGIVSALLRPRARDYRNAGLRGAWAGLRGCAEALRARKKIQRERVVPAWKIAQMMVWTPLKRGGLHGLRDLPGS